jgi:RHS repeat-associated protein
VEGGLTYTQTFDAENRLISVTVSGQPTQFIYDGDGNLVKKVKPDNSKTIYPSTTPRKAAASLRTGPGGIYEVDKTSGGSVTRTVTYYPVAGAMRINSTLYYTLKDHLGSASVVTDASGNILGENRYYPYGETRLTTGTIFTDKLFTGQREMAGLGIYHYNARFYSPKLGRFLSADTIVPGYGNPQNLNRFSYVRNNPLRYTDPTGHVVADDGGGGSTCNIFTSSCNTSGGGGGCNTLASCIGGSGGSGSGGGGGSGGGNSGGCNTLASCIGGSGGSGSGGSGGSGGGNGGGCNTLASCADNNSNSGGGHPLASPDPDDIKWCEWLDCILSGVGFFSSAFTFAPPPIDLIATGVDLVATLWSIGRTEDDFSQREISNTRRWLLHGTAGLGLAPAWLGPQFGFIGAGASILNLFFTVTGLPN